MDCAGSPQHPTISSPSRFSPPCSAGACWACSSTPMPPAVCSSSASSTIWPTPQPSGSIYDHCGRPTGSSTPSAHLRPEQVLAYLSRYTHRVAISNGRLISADASGVTFKYKDYRIEGPDRYKTMTLEPGEFIRRSCTSCPRDSTTSDTACQRRRHARREARPRSRADRRNRSSRFTAQATP